MHVASGVRLEYQQQPTLIVYRHYGGGTRRVARPVHAKQHLSRSFFSSAESRMGEAAPGLLCAVVYL